MSEKRDVKKIFEWAAANGEAKIVDRILVKILPELLRDGVHITAKTIKDSETIELSSELYETIKSVSEELVGSSWHS